MLHGIDPVLTADLLHSLAAMGHGDRIAIVDANFPAASHNSRVHALAGVDAGSALRAILSLLPLDTYVPDAAITMQVVGDAAAIPDAVAEFTEILRAHGACAPMPCERFDFYAQARSAYAIVHTGERRLYGNIILGKGVIA